ncbi:hypothetical protein A2U01_0008961 [Trifolium medium]|uniref:Retrotransposon gag domain-containing protein n=1 Tax=Trifolium medium TaxID=97028 RepID=A0A392MKR7_9FABA|nr:hypothetical protein [Trifolium medium]
MDKFRRSVKKVELLMFNGDDPAGWIARAEVYFRVMDTSSKVKVSLAQLCMEEATIHFFKALIEEVPDDMVEAQRCHVGTLRWNWGR